MKHRSLFALVALTAVCVAGSTSLPAQTTGALPPPPSPPPPQPVTTTLYGTTVTDPYRFFEHLNDPVVQAYFKTQNDYTQRVLALLGAPREALYRRIRQLDQAGISLGSLQRVGDRYFYESLHPGDASPKLYVRAVAGGRERLLLDPQRFVRSAGQHETIDFAVPSLDGAYVAVGISEGGSENDVTHVVRVADGHLLRDTITRTLFGVTGWDPSGRAFYYNRLPQLPPNTPPAERESRAIVYRHVLGADPNRDRPVFGIGVVPGITLAPDDLSAVVVSPAAPYAFAQVSHGVSNEISLFAEPLTALEANRPAWRLIVDPRADVTNWDVRGGVVFLLTHRDDPDFAIASAPIAQPLHRTTVLKPARGSIVEAFSVARDGLYVSERTGGIGRVLRLGWTAGGRPAAPIAARLPYDGDVTGLVTDPRTDGATFGLTAWTKSLLYYATRANMSVANTGLKPLSPIDESAYTSREVLARSADGTRVPLSIVFKRGLALDGSHYAYLEGYGAYGETLLPYFSNLRLAWLERNGVYAVCHPRGGGWYGEAWHRAGMLTQKAHTVDDFIACAHYLVDHGYTTSARLAGEGTSAGGITIGRAITREPGLFAAALDIVGVSDALRSETEENGPANTPEFGSTKTAAGFRALDEDDAYLHVRPGVAYPAVMLFTGINDRRVAPWELAKFTAALQAASTSRRPILLDVGYDQGHGFLGASSEQTERVLADQYAFLLWQLGGPAFTLPRRYAVPSAAPSE